MKKLICMITGIVILAFSTVPAWALVNGVFLGSDQNGVNIINDKLCPGQEYLFPVLVAVDGAPPTQLTSRDLSRNQLEVRPAMGSSAIEALTVEEHDGLVFVRLVPGAQGSTGDQPASLRINYRSRDSLDNITVIPSITVGYTPMPDAVLASLEPGDFLQLDNQAPIVTPDQWNSLSQLNEYRSVTMTGDGWQYTANTTRLGKRNMLATRQPDTQLAARFPDHQLQFIGFPGEPTFEGGGRLSLDVSPFAESYNHDFYLYRMAYGQLYPLNYEYDRKAGEISLRPEVLGRYVIADRPLADATEETQTDSPSSPSSPSSNSDDASTDRSGQELPLLPNPGTGVHQGGLMAYIVGLVSLAGLGIMHCSKRRP